MSGADLTPLPSHAGSAARITIGQLTAVVGVAAVLFVAQDVFVPLAIAMLITFALSPLVTALRRRGLPLLWSVLIVVAFAFSLIAVFSFMVASQLAQLAQNLPIFQSNIIHKVEGLKATGGENGLASRLFDMITAISTEIGAALPSGEEKPLPVEVVQSSNALAFLENLVLPLVSPIATIGLVIVVVIFMLLEREDLRDRFIRLVGTNDLYRTTQVLEEAGGRVANYLLVQLLVNTIYAIPIGVGLYFIGVPNPVLWGMLTLVLRFVPYIGSALAAAFPLFLAFAVAPDWSAVLWTGALFIAIELITSNIIEPWLYGSRTGVSPLAIIVAAIFWTFLWGPLGLILSTPLTVCLVVLGRHIPQFALFDILFGDEPMLAPHAKLYQRMLAGDAMEATVGATEALEELDVVDYHQTAMIPALLLAQDDSERGVLTADQQDRLATVALEVVADLKAEMEAERDAAASQTALPGLGLRLRVVGGRSSLDDVSAAVLAQVLQTEGAAAQFSPHLDLAPSRLASLDTANADCLLLCYLDPRPARASLLHIRRIKRAAPHLRVGVVILQMPADLADSASGMRHLHAVSPDKLVEAENIGADFAVTSLEAAMDAVWQRGTPKLVPDSQKPTPRVVARRRSNAVA